MIGCFISHTWREGEHHFAIRLAEALRRRGGEVWIDEEQILPGRSIKERIRAGVEHECDVFLFVMSPESLKSKSCLYELKRALEQRQESGKQIIPVFFKECEIPKSLAGILYADFRNPLYFDAALDRLLLGIQHAAKIRSLFVRLGDEEPEERIQAASSFATLRDPSTVPVIARCRSTDHAPYVQYWLAIALGEIGGKQAIAALEQAMGEPAHPLAIRGVIDALKILRDSGLKVVLKAASSDNPIKRCAAARFLLQMDSNASCAKAILAQLKNDPDERVRSIVQYV